MGGTSFPPSALITTNTPTTEPVSAGVWWLNNGALTLSQGIAPAFTTQPSSTAIEETETATFTVVATNASTYQWQLDSGSGFTDIAGATSASYTTGDQALSNNADEYRCVVTGEGGSTTSSVAVLTVTIPQMPAGAKGIWFAKDFDSSLVAVPNVASDSNATVQPLLTRHPRGAFATGAVGGEGFAGGWLGGGFGGCTTTEKHEAGRDGVVAATRAVFSSGTSGIRYRKTFSLSAGTYTMVIDAKSNTGSSQDFQMSRDGLANTVTRTATTSWQQFKNEFTLSSATTVDLRFLFPPSGDGDFVIDKAFLWSGDAASVPADLTLEGDLYFGNSSKTTDVTYASGEITLASGAIGSIDFNDFVTGNEVTMLAVVKRTVDYNNVAGYRYPFMYDVVESSVPGATTAWSLGEFEAEGEITASFGGRRARPAGGFSPNLFTDGGYHVISASADASALDLWLDDVSLALETATAGQSDSSRKFQVGNKTASFGFLKFKLNALALYDRKLTDVERRKAISIMIATASDSGITITKPTNHLIAGFDSITADADSYVHEFLPNATSGLVAQNEAIGGSTLSLNPTVALNLDVRSPYHIAGIPADASDRSGRRFVVTLHPGANDLQPNYAGDVTAFLDELWAITDPIRARGGHLGIATILPKGTSVTGAATHNTARATANTQIRSLLGTKFDFLIDFAADATMGPDSAADNASLYGDGLHPTASAHSTYLEPIYRAAVNGVLL